MSIHSWLLSLGTSCTLCIWNLFQQSLPDAGRHRGTGFPMVEHLPHFCDTLASQSTMKQVRRFLFAVVSDSSNGTSEWDPKVLLVMNKNLGQLLDKKHVELKLNWIKQELTFWKIIWYQMSLCFNLFFNTKCNCKFSNN